VERAIAAGWGVYASIKVVNLEFQILPFRTVIFQGSVGAGRAAISLCIS
jgi:hypothetical protein